MSVVDGVAATSASGTSRAAMFTLSHPDRDHRHL